MLISRVRNQVNWIYSIKPSETLQDTISVLAVDNWGLFNYNELAGREQLPDATTGKEAAESDTGNNDTDSKMEILAEKEKQRAPEERNPGLIDSSENYH